LTHFLLTEPAIFDLLADGFYIGDFTGGAGSIEEGFEIYQRARELMQKCGFNLRKWKTNSTDLQKKIDGVENQASNHLGSIQNQLEAKILGLNWNTKQDNFYFDFKQLNSYVKSLLPTRHSILRVTAKLFNPLGPLNPLGLLSPFVNGTKILFRSYVRIR